MRQEIRLVDEEDADAEPEVPGDAAFPKFGERDAMIVSLPHLKEGEDFLVEKRRCLQIPFVLTVVAVEDASGKWKDQIKARGGPRGGRERGNNSLQRESSPARRGV